ncbi:MAG: sigma-70 family RNA polymerase sigma factor [Pseudomonadota bacterium]
MDDVFRDGPPTSADVYDFQNTHINDPAPERTTCDRHILTGLYKTYFPKLSATLRKLYGNGPPDPDDIAQAAFQKVIECGKINEIRSLEAFIWRTARNLMFKAHRSNEVRTRYDFEIDAIFFPLKTDELTPERVIVAKEQLNAINKKLLTMPAKRRRAFLLHRISGLTVTAVAKQLGVSRSTADEHISRAAADLSRLFSDSLGN